MAEYIKREAIELRYEFGMVSECGIICIPLRDVKKSIANTPTADVVEVVRCKDCISYNKRYGECTRYGAHLGENGYCSSGIRKEGVEK